MAPLLKEIHKPFDAYLYLIILELAIDGNYILELAIEEQAT